MSEGGGSGDLTRLDRVVGLLGLAGEASQKIQEGQRRREWDADLSELVSLLKERVESRLTTAQDERYVELRRELMSEQIFDQEAVDFLTRHRTLQQFWDRTASRYSSYRERRTVVDDAFDSTLRRLEDRNAPLRVQSIDGLDGPLEDDTLVVLTIPAARRECVKARKRLEEGDLDGALTMTRSLLESVSKQILNSRNIDYPASDKTAALVKRCLSALLGRSEPDTAYVSQLSRSAANLVDHLESYRNAAGDAHGAVTPRENAIHAVSYAVKLAEATSVFLIQCNGREP